jgi:hypothetical protein
MTTSTNSFYPGKQEFDMFLASLPTDEQTLSEKDILSLSLQAAELFNKGIPHKDRSTCLYYFYHFLGLNLASSSNSELINQVPTLPGFAVSSLSEPSILEYLKLLDGNKLYEVCQIRGEIKMYSIELVQFIAGKSTKSWDEIAKEAESFLTSEPVQSQSFLEFYFDGIYLSKNSNARRYELADNIWETSTNTDSLKHAWLTLNDDDDIRAFKKDSLPPKESKKIFELEQIEQEVMAEFGDNWHGRNTLGKALQFLSKQGREEKKALDELQTQWIVRIKRPLNFSDNDPYVNGYAAFLIAFVKGGTDDLKGAVKELKRALDYKFDTASVLSLLVPLLDSLKKNEEAANYAQQLVDVMSLQENEQKQDLLQSVFLVFKTTGLKPIWANRIWEGRVQENQNKVSSIIKALEPTIESAKKINFEQRMQAGIKLLDDLFPVTKADEALNNNSSFSSINIPNSVDNILELSIEELEVFNKTGIDKLAFLFNPTIKLDNLLNYNEMVINNFYGNLSVNIEPVLKAFPNTLSCIPLSKKYITELMIAEKQDYAKRLADHLCMIRTTRVEGLYDAIKPIQQEYHSKQQFRQEIEFITHSKKLLNEREEKQATIDLTEAYVDLLCVEKSLNEKDRLLKSAAIEQLQDERLNKLRVEVDALLYKRKKMLIRVGIILGTAIVLFIVIYVLFIK